MIEDFHVQKFVDQIKGSFKTKTSIQRLWERPDFGGDPKTIQKNCPPFGIMPFWFLSIGHATPRCKNMGL
jgi:hypothetical protein